MGVKDLWRVLSHVHEDCHLKELSCKTLAVDLSGWICQAVTAKVRGKEGRDGERRVRTRREKERLECEGKKIIHM